MRTASLQDLINTTFNRRESLGGCAPLAGCLNSQLELWYASYSRTASCRVTVNGTARSFAGDGPGVGLCRSLAAAAKPRQGGAAGVCHLPDVKPGSL